MSADLLKALQTQLAASSEALACGGAGSAEETLACNAFARKGCDRLHKLLKSLADVFPENGKLTMWLVLYETTILNKPEMEEWAMKRWHTEMTQMPDGTPREVSLYTKTRERDIDGLLSSGVWVLDEIDARSMYFDDGIDDDDREVIAVHFDGVNACAQWLDAMPTDMMERVLGSVRDIDPTQPITPETMFAILQKTIGLSNEEGDGETDAVERIVGWTSQMLSTLKSGGIESLMSIAGESSSLAGSGLPDIASLMSTMQGELLGSSSLFSSSVDTMDAAQMSSLNEVLKTLTTSSAK